jgi:hypothetical protein
VSTGPATTDWAGSQQSAMPTAERRVLADFVAEVAGIASDPVGVLVERAGLNRPLMSATVVATS